MKNNVLILLIVAIVIVAAVTWLWLWPKANMNGGGAVYCTQEAKLCPDGSYVGRTGPNCEFAACPIENPGTLLKLHLNESGKALGVRITPLEVTEDSRCPVDVTCIWAGRVTVRVKLESGLGTAVQLINTEDPVTTEAEVIRLTNVLPPKMTNTAINPADYIFTFSVSEKTSDIEDASKG